MLRLVMSTPINTSAAPVLIRTSVVTGIQAHFAWGIRLRSPRPDICIPVAQVVVNDRDY